MTSNTPLRSVLRPTELKRYVSRRNKYSEPATDRIQSIIDEQTIKGYRFTIKFYCGGKMKRLLFCVIAVIFISGCATIFTGSSDPITFKSVPEGAKVVVNGASIGRTPVTVPIKRSLTPPQVQIKLDGYDTQYIMLQNSFNGVAILDVFFLPGFIVDAATGTIMKYDILNYEAELEAKN